MKITVQICDWCNKPHSGRSRVEDRCICDGFGHFHMGEIEEEYVAPMTNIKLPTAKRTNIVNVRIRSNKKVLLGKEFIVKSVELKDGEVIIKYTYKK